MSNYMSMYSGISGQAHASAYSNTVVHKKAKPNVFDSLQDSISQHRSSVNSRYSNLI